MELVVWILKTSESKATRDLKDVTDKKIVIKTGTLKLRVIGLLWIRFALF